MPLGRRLAITLSLMFLAMLIGVEAIYLRSAQRHLQDQLESHAQDAATSLGLSLGIVLDRGDSAMAETVIGAAFDRGFYQRVEFLGPEGGAPLVSRTLPVEDDRLYPGWFAELFPLYPPTAESLVSAGWRQLGKVRVTSHPRFAYVQFWSAARNTFLWLLSIYVVALGLLRFFLRSVLRPLRDVEVAANAISRRDFVTVERIPSTRELASVVVAMNALSGKVRDALQAETSRAARLQEAADYDSVSGLLNRAGFSARFESRYREEAQVFSGTLALLKLSQLARLNELRGDQAGDRLLAAAGRAICRETGEQALVGRWTGAMLVIALPVNSASDVLDAVLAAVGAEIDQLDAPVGTVVAHIGAVRADGILADLVRLVEAAELQLNAALTDRAGSPLVKHIGNEAQTPEEERLRQVRVSIEAGHVTLVSQPALSTADGTELHRELMGRLMDGEGRQMPATEFMPMVLRLGMSGMFDRMVLRLAMAGARTLSGASRLALNIAPASLSDVGFPSWVADTLPSQMPPGLQLAFEISERGLLEDLPAAERFAAALAKAKVELGIDHFGLHRDSLSLVQRLKPAYLKLSATHTQGVITDPGKRFFVESLVRAAAQLDIPVYAQGVEDEERLAAYRVLGIRGYQGYLVGRPAAWP